MIQNDWTGSWKGPIAGLAMMIHLEVLLNIHVRIVIDKMKLQYVWQITSNKSVYMVEIRVELCEF